MLFGGTVQSGLACFVSCLDSSAVTGNIEAPDTSMMANPSREPYMSVVWKTYRVGPDEGAWEPAAYNVHTEDGQEYGRWRRVPRKHPHGLTVISRYKAPPGKAWKIVGKASELGEEIYIIEGAYYDAQGSILAGPGTFMFNAPGAPHGGGERDEIVSIDLIDFEPNEHLSTAPA
jgi:hypothetical protein